MFHPGGVDDDNDEEYGCYHSAAAFPSNNTYYMNGDSLQIEQANRVRRQSIALQLVSQTCPHPHMRGLNP